MKTQASSAPRLKNDTLGDDALKQLYTAFEKMNIEEFRTLAESMVQSGGGKQPTKDAIIADFHKPNATKATILTKAQNFILAGMGLGV